MNGDDKSRIVSDEGAFRSYVVDHIEKHSDRLTRIETVVTSIKDTEHDQELRLRSCEKKLWAFGGAATAAGAIAGIIAGFFKK